MKKLYFLLLFLMMPSAAWSQDTGFYIREDCAEITAPVNNQTLCLQSTTTGGRTAGVVYVYTNNAWTSVTSTGAGDVTDVTGTASEITVTNSGGPAPSIAIADSFRIGGHTATAPVKIGTAVPGTCTIGDLFFDSDATAGSNFYGCTALNTWTLEGGTTAAAASVTFAPNGSIAATDVQTAIQEVRDEAQPLDADLTALAALSTTGCLARTAANTYVVRTVTGTTGNITVTNGDCISGNPTLDLGATAVQTDQSNTWTTGDQSMAAASSFTLPSSVGAAPTGAGRCAYDSTLTPGVFKCGFGGTTLTLATTNLTQPINTNLTGISALVPVANSSLVYTGSAWSKFEFPSCSGAGQAINFDTTTHSSSCVTLSGSISGLSVGKIPKAASATTLTDSIMSETASVVTVGGGLVVGSTPWLILDTSAIAASDKTWTVLNFSGTIRPSTGAITAGHVLTIDANGLIVDGGVAGAGTWTDSSTNTADNKTVVATEAGGTNTLTTGIAPYWDAESLTLPSGSTCTQAAVAAINSGPSGNFVNCTNFATSTFEGRITIKQAVATVTFTLTVNDVDSSAQHFVGNFSAQCRNNATTVNNTWGTVQAVDITMTTANQNYTGTTPALTPNGTCSAGATLFWRFVVDTTSPSPFTDDGDARVIGVLMKQAS